MVEPRINVICTNDVTEKGRKFFLTANFVIPATIINHLKHEIITYFVLSAKEPKVCELYTNFDYNKIETARIVKDLCGNFIKGHLFFEDSVMGLCAMEIKVEEALPLQRPEKPKKEIESWAQMRKNLRKCLENEDYLEAAKWRDLITKNYGEKAEGQAQ